jgi:ribosomal protein S18 acetylase RimI-like enzyme
MASDSPDRPLPAVRRATKADVAGTSEALARAFERDPNWAWFLPDEASRVARLRLVFASYARHIALRHGNDCFTTDGYAGAALWVPPGHGKMSARDTLRTFPDWIRAIGWRELLRAQRGLASFAAVHPHEQHYYLPFVGVVPEAQGQGLGTALIMPVLDKCDRDNVPAYLEATSEDSRRCYERLGFETRSEERIAGDGPVFFPMWRTPSR